MEMVPMFSLSTTSIRAHPLSSAGRVLTVRCVSISPREPKHTVPSEDMNTKIASRKAISTILRREATKAIIEKKNNSKKLLARTVPEALHDRITALRWESALQVFELLRQQLWYKQPEKAHQLFQEMISEGCVANHRTSFCL